VAHAGHQQAAVDGRDFRIDPPVISYIVATNDREVLERDLLDTLYLQDGDELILIEDPPSIAVAYNQGTADAFNRIRCYVHSDVRVLDSARLRAELIEHCTAEVGMVGLIGSVDLVLPWWFAMTTRGSVADARIGMIDRGAGGVCGYLDGLLLATVQDLEWDESYPGFHLYDHDICQQMLARGLPNYCLTDGAEMVLHNTGNAGAISELDGWDSGMARFRDKWGNV
jgi:hypothetical protein